MGDFQGPTVHLPGGKAQASNNSATKTWWIFSHITTEARSSRSLARNLQTRSLGKPDDRRIKKTNWLVNGWFIDIKPNINENTIGV